MRLGSESFGDPFGFLPQPEVVDLVAKPVTLRILAVPGRPDFTGPVGRFDLTAKADRTRVNVGEAVTFSVRLSGTGNLRTAAGAPRLEVQGARVYPPSTRSEPERTSGGRRRRPSGAGSSCRPHRASSRFPPVSMEVFDPVEKRVVTKATQPIALIAEGGPKTSPAAAPGGRRRGDDAPRTAPAGADRGGGSRGTEPTPMHAAVDLSHGTVTLPLWALARDPRRGARRSAVRSSWRAVGAGATGSVRPSHPSRAKRRSARQRASTGRFARRSRAGTVLAETLGPADSSRR